MDCLLTDKRYSRLYRRGTAKTVDVKNRLDQCGDYWDSSLTPECAKRDYSRAHTIDKLVSGTGSPYSFTLSQATDLDDEIYSEASKLLRKVSLKQPLRLLGLSMHNLTGKLERQLSLFSEPQKDNETLTKVIDSLKEKYGDKSITRARLL